MSISLYACLFAPRIIQRGDKIAAFILITLCSVKSFQHCELPRAMMESGLGSLYEYASVSRANELETESVRANEKHAENVDNGHNY